jgi:microcystin-dependent protein
MENTMKKCLLIFFLCSSSAFATVPNKITYQGRLHEYGLPVNASRTMSFQIWNQVSGGAMLWSKEDVSVTVSSGVFTYVLEPNIDWLGGNYYLQLIINGKSLSPREMITSQVFSLHSASAENIKSNTNVNFSISNSTFMVITDAGKVGINTVSPLSTLHVNGSFNLLPSGTIILYAGNAPPEGWLLCDGNAVSRVQYADLFNIIGIAYGEGNGSTTFNLADLRDRFAIGKSSSRQLASYGGDPTITLTENEIPAHSHTGTTDETHIAYAYSGSSGVGLTVSETRIRNDGGYHSHDFTTNPAGGNNPHKNIPPYLSLNYLIKY